MINGPVGNKRIGSSPSGSPSSFLATDLAPAAENPISEAQQISTNVRRTKNYWLTHAHQATEIVSLDYRNAYGQWDRLKADAALYQEEVHDQTLILEHEETGVLLKIPYKTRFSSAYLREKLKKLRRVASKLQVGRAFFWTFTLDPSRFLSLKDMHEGLSYYWNRLLSAIKKRYGAKIAYIKILETQKSGMLHLHVLFDTWIDIGFIRNLWADIYGAGIEINVKRVYDHAGVAHYIMKYLTKTLADDIDAGEPNMTKVILWALYARSFSYARLLDQGLTNSNQYRALLSPSLMDPDEKGHWIYLGAVPNSIAERPDSEILDYIAGMNIEKDF